MAPSACKIYKQFSEKITELPLLEWAHFTLNYAYFVSETALLKIRVYGLEKKIAKIACKAPV